MLESDIGLAKQAIDMVSSLVNISTKTLSTIKEFRGSSKGVRESELLELEEYLLEIKRKAIEADKKVYELDLENVRLRKRLSIRPRLIMDNGSYILKDNEENGDVIAELGNGPWCSRCFDVDGILVNVHIHTVGTGFSDYKFKLCPQCKSKTGKDLTI